MKQIRLTKGLYALVDDEDYDWLMQWAWYASNESRGTKWYAIRREKGRKIRMHVAIFERHYGPAPKGRVIDHVNHNSLDNRKLIDNGVYQLEAVTQAENMRRSPGWKKRGVKARAHLTTKVNHNKTKAHHQERGF